MKTLKILFKYAGVICIPIYVCSTIISYCFDTKINPLTNWLSDFGNPFENPSGALIYNLGCIITAAILVFFYIGLYQWYAGRKISKKYVICYMGAQITGIIAAVFLVLASIFPLGTNTEMHGIFSMINMIGMDFFMSFIAIAFLMNPNIKKWIGVFGYASAVFNIVTTNAISLFYAAEWIYFALFMIYMVIIAVNYNKIMQCKTEDWKQNTEDRSKGTFTSV